MDDVHRDIPVVAVRIKSKDPGTKFLINKRDFNPELYEMWEPQKKRSTAKAKAESGG